LDVMSLVIYVKIFQSGETWSEGECTTCSCTDGEELCNKTCNITSCPTVSPCLVLGSYSILFNQLRSCIKTKFCF
jgi:hypothetical protein